MKTIKTFINTKTSNPTDVTKNCKFFKERSRLGLVALVTKLKHDRLEKMFKISVYKIYQFGM